MTIDASKISKTTLIGGMLFAVVALQAVKFDPAGHLAMTAKDWFSIVIAGLIAAVAKLQKDAS